jgi:hypothetical protein
LDDAISEIQDTARKFRLILQINFDYKEPILSYSSTYKYLDHYLIEIFSSFQGIADEFFQLHRIFLNSTEL